MRNYIRIFALLLFASIVLAPLGSVSAVEDATTQAVEATSLEATTEKVETTTTTPTDKSAGREARIKTYEEKVETKLAEAKSKRIASRCKAAQGKITSLRARVQGIVEKRKSSYQTIGEKLDTLVAQLQKAGVDTTALETAQQDIKADLVALDESMSAYDTVLADLEAMDCAADPALFAAALESAREFQKTVRDQAQAFREFATTQLKTLITDARQQLEAKTSEGSDS